MSRPLDIRLLGPLMALVDGRPASVGGGKRQGLLALLALRCERVVPVDALIEALWGEDLPAAPRNAVQHHVARLRATLGQAAIVASPDGYALVGATVDALEFEELLADARGALRAGDPATAVDALEAALQLWRAPALLGLTDTPWFDDEARRLDSLRVDAVEEKFEAALALGEHREVVAAIRAALGEHPFRERLWGQLMVALYRSGRQPDALAAFGEARRVLADELGLEPGPELQRLQEAILAHDPAIAPFPVRRRHRGNLPAPATSLVGRESALTQVIGLVRDRRLVTLTGPPGVGKSRLALEAAHSLKDEFPDGAWFVDLHQGGDEGDVLRLVAHAVDARGADPLARVVERLRDADALLWLDGCGAVVGEAARVASAVITGCPGIRVLATSRELLHVPGEVRVTVEPLARPSPEDPDSVDSAAVRLFIERAQAARPGFELTAETAPLVAEITRLVDGLPLAIELAAARTHVLGLSEIRSLVEQRLHLRDGRASQEARAAMVTLVEWSYDLLHADEKSMLHHVAVHQGGASLPSLVAAGATDGLDGSTVTYLLGVLVDKSILSVSFPSEGARYDVLETVRNYVLECLDESGRLEAARRVHAEYVATLADAARAELRGPNWKAWIDRLELEHDNLWVALTYALDACDAGVAARLGSLAWYFILAERVTPGRRFLELALGTASETVPLADRLELLAFHGYLATEEFDVDAAIAIGEGALADTATGTVPPEIGLVEAVLARAVAEAGDLERAVALAERGCATLGNGGSRWAIAAASLLRAQVAALVGDVATVAAMASEVSRHAEATRFDAFDVPATLLEAWVAERGGDSRAATDAYGRTLDLAERTELADHAAFALSALASHALTSGELARAEELARRALAVAEAAGAELVAAQARVQLARVLGMAGDIETAEGLYRDTLAWSTQPRAHGPRESLFVALADDPATAAVAGLAELGGKVTAPASA